MDFPDALFRDDSDVGRSDVLVRDSRRSLDVLRRDDVTKLCQLKLKMDS